MRPLWADFVCDGWKGPYLCSDLFHKPLLKKQFEFRNLLASTLHRLLGSATQTTPQMTCACICTRVLCVCRATGCFWCRWDSRMRVPLLSDSPHLPLVGSCSISPLNSITDGHRGVSVLLGNSVTRVLLKAGRGAGRTSLHLETAIKTLTADPSLP